MAEAIYWRSSSWTWSKGCKEPPGCSSKVIIKFSIIMFLFFHMSCNFLTLFSHTNEMGTGISSFSWAVCNAHRPSFLPLFYCIGTTGTIWYVSLSLCLGSISRAFQVLTLISQWHVGPIWIIDMWVRVWNPERLTNWNPNSEISCVKTGTSFSKLWVSYLFPYWMFCMIKQSQTCFCITSAWLLIFCFMKVQYASIWFTLLTRQDWPDVVIGTFLTILWPPLIWTI